AARPGEVAQHRLRYLLLRQIARSAVADEGEDRGAADRRHRQRRRHAGDAFTRDRWHPHGRRLRQHVAQQIDDEGGGHVFEQQRAADERVLELRRKRRQALQEQRRNAWRDNGRVERELRRVLVCRAGVVLLGERIEQQIPLRPGERRRDLPPDDGRRGGL